MGHINKDRFDANDKNSFVFIKYISKLAIDAIIIIDIIIPFLYFNFGLGVKELLGCAGVFFGMFILFSIIYWPKYIQRN